MAEFVPAVEKTLLAEGGYYHNPATGEYANLGITLKTLRSLGVLMTSGPATPEDIKFVKSLTEDEAKDIYWESYWDKLRLDEITSQDVANKVFDLAVNTGPGTAVKLLQRALPAVLVDGIIGPKTIWAANSCDPLALLARIRDEAAHHYEQIAANNPALAPDLPGWLNRLNS